MKINVQYFAHIREIVGQRQETVEVRDQTNVLELLKLLATKHGAVFEQYVFDPSTAKPKTFLQFLINEESISSLDGLETILSENSKFAIIPPVGGG
jgi:MoaD family protein